MSSSTTLSSRTLDVLRAEHAENTYTSMEGASRAVRHVQHTTTSEQRRRIENVYEMSPTIVEVTI